MGVSRVIANLFFGGGFLAFGVGMVYQIKWREEKREEIRQQKEKLTNALTAGVETVKDKAGAASEMVKDQTAEAAEKAKKAKNTWRKVTPTDNFFWTVKRKEPKKGESADGGPPKAKDDT